MQNNARTYHKFIEFDNYQDAIEFTREHGGKIDGPIYDYDNRRVYLVEYLYKKFNFADKQ